MDKFYFYDLLQAGFNKQQEAAKKRETETTGIWRGGSSGCITPAGKVIGEDPRTVILRFLGVQIPTDYDKQLMFDAGFANEDYINKLLAKSGAMYKCEEEIPMRSQLPNGEMITGRPDCVIGITQDIGGDEYEWIPRLGIEHKAICSPFAGFDRAAWGRGEADTKHVVQACNYAGFFKIPWVLAYTSRSWYGFPFFAAANEEKFVSNPDHRAISRDEKSGKPFMFKSFQTFYDIVENEEGFFELDGEPTEISYKGIIDFYQYCSDCIKNKEIPKLRAGGTDHFGKNTRKNKTLQYYSFKEADSVTDFDEWLDACRQIAEEV